MYSLEIEIGSMDLMLILGLNETMDQLAMKNSVRLEWSCAPGEDGHVLRRALDFEDEGQSKKWRLKRT